MARVRVCARVCAGGTVRCTKSLLSEFPVTMILKLHYGFRAGTSTTDVAQATHTVLWERGARY